MGPETVNKLEDSEIYGDFVGFEQWLDERMKG